MAYFTIKVRYDIRNTGGNCVVCCLSLLIKCHISVTCHVSVRCVVVVVSVPFTIDRSV